MADGGARILDGKSLSWRLQEQIKSEIKSLRIHPCLAVALVGDDPASNIYVSHKEKACENVGIRRITLRLSGKTNQNELMDFIHDWNEDKSIHGILVQLPLPSHMDKTTIVNAVSPVKDVDGFNSINLGGIIHGNPRFMPCTPLAVQHLLYHHKINTGGKHIVIINNSIVVGHPLSLMLSNAGATVTVCHKETPKSLLYRFIKDADILVTAVGRRSEFIITTDMVKKDQVVIDVGVSRIGGKIYGDVDFEQVAKVVSAITPPVGGVGPLTVAMLLRNTVQAAKGSEQ